MQFRHTFLLLNFGTGSDLESLETESLFKTVPLWWEAERIPLSLEEISLPLEASGGLHSSLLGFVLADFSSITTMLEVRDRHSLSHLNKCTNL